MLTVISEVRLLGCFACLSARWVTPKWRGACNSTTTIEQPQLHRALGDPHNFILARTLPKGSAERLSLCISDTTITDSQCRALIFMRISARPM